MTELDRVYAANGGDHPRPETRSMPYFPPPPGTAVQPAGGTAPSTGHEVPLGAPTMTPTGGRHTPAPAEPEPAREPEPQRTAADPVTEVEGTITVEDEVIEKIAGLAALEVAGVSGLSTHAGPAVRVRAGDNEAELDLAVVVEYGSVVMETATVVQTNVARVVGRMLGMRVTAVNVTVDDVTMPAESPAS